MDCLFCRIVSGDIPSVKVYEDDHVIGIMDINPLTEGHLLVLPRKHAENLFDIDDALAADTMRAASRIAKRVKVALGIEAMTLIQASGALADQELFHLHLHLIPRRQGDNVPIGWKPAPGDMDTIRATGERIAAAMG